MTIGMATGMAGGSAATGKGMATTSKARKALGIAEGAGPVVRSIFRVIYYLVPDLASFNYIAAAGYGGTVTARLAGGLILYAVVALAVIICATIAVFERRDIR